AVLRCLRPAESGTSETRRVAGGLFGEGNEYRYRQHVGAAGERPAPERLRFLAFPEEPRKRDLPAFRPQGAGTDRHAALAPHPLRCTSPPRFRLSGGRRRAQRAAETLPCRNSRLAFP